MRTFVLSVLFLIAMLGHLSVPAQADDIVPSQLLEGVIAKDFSVVDQALEDGENIDLTNPNGWSAVRFAVSDNDLGMVNHLIDAGIDLNNVDNNGYSPLMIAAANADKEMVETLLNGHASPLLVANDGTTAYSAAVAAGRPLVALMIAEAGVLHGIEGDNLATALEHLRHGAYVNIRNDVGWTPLMLATSKNDIEAVRELVNLPGVDVNRSENDGWTALHFAAVNGFDEIASLLLQHGADALAETRDGRLAKDIAREQGHLSTVEVIPDTEPAKMD